MSKRSVFTAGAVGLALLLLALTFLLAPSQPRVSQSTAPATVPPGQSPPGLQSSATQRPITPGSAKNYFIETKTKRGQLVQIFGATYTPLPQGRSLVEKPLARIYLTNTSVLEIQADRGTLLAPENQPRSGELMGKVILSYFQGPAGRALNFSPNSPDLSLRAVLDGARFDLELGQIESPGHVHASSRQFDFQGEGLSLTYNQLRNRIERLEIPIGHSLRIKSGLANSASAAPPANASAAAPTATPGGCDSPTPSGNKPPSSTPGPTYYLARFDNQVQVKNRDLNLDGDQLQVVFSLAGRAGQSTPQENSNPPSAAKPLAPVADSTAPPVATVDLDQSLAPVDEQDLIITWTGRLLVEPLPQKPPELAGPDDALLALVGQPIHITTARQENISAASVAYLLSSATVHLRSTPQTPLLINAPQLGLLRAHDIIINQLAATGMISGAGVLRARDAEAPAAGSVTDVAIAAGLPPGMSIAWSQGLELSFYPRAQTERAQPGFSRLQAIKTATFKGQVIMAHPEMDLSADSLGLTLDDPVQGKQTFQQFNAAGHVHVLTHATAQQPAVSMQSDQLQVELTRGQDGQPHPARFLAQGHVDTQSTGRRIRADLLDLALQANDGIASSSLMGWFGPSAATQQPGTLRVFKLLAQGAVHVELEDMHLSMIGQRLTADAASDTMELLGAEPQPAQVRQPDGILTGQKILLRQTNQTIQVAGPGAFQFTERPTPAAASSTPVNTTWQQSMSFDNATGQARFTGQVVTTSQTEHDTIRLTCDDLQLAFSNTAKSAADAALQRAGRQLQSFTATKDVVFQDETWANHPNGKLASRLRITGPILAFTNAQQSVRVIGAGSMLVEDYRFPPGTDTSVPMSPPPGNTPADQLGLSFAGGSGQTLFTWQKELAFDVFHNHMDMRDGVQMVHRPAADAKIVQMDCSVLQADLAGSSGMNVWLSGQSAAPKLKQVVAQNNVVVRADERVIHTDTLTYTEADQSVLLQADEGRLTEIADPQQPQPYTAQAFRWNLHRNRLEIIHPGPGRLPVK